MGAEAHSAGSRFRNGAVASQFLEPYCILNLDDTLLQKFINRGFFSISEAGTKNNRLY